MPSVKEKILSLKSNERFISFEFFPPKTDAGFRNLLARLSRMLALNPLFITVTWGAGGSTSEKSLDLAATCQKELGLTTVLHLTCTNTNKEIIDDALSKAKSNGIRNILALRGDPPRTEEYWTPNCDFNNAVDLVRYIKQQYGDYFCIGVAGYPEGHVDGSDNSQQSIEKDIPYLIEKIEAGADFIITQLFFDVDKFLNYEKVLRSYPQLSNIILIPGLMPITTYKVFTRSTKLSHASVPDDIATKLHDASVDDDKVKSLGIDIIDDIITNINNHTDNRIRGYHFYCLNLEKAVASIINKSNVLLPIMDLHESVDNNDDAIASDSDDDLDANQVRMNRRKSSIVNENEPSTSKQDVLNGQKSLIGKALLDDKKTLVDISIGKGALGKDATWDEFPNGRFGDSNSPAYGEIDGYGPTLKLHSTKEIENTWGSPESTKDIIRVFIDYLSNKIDLLPWVDTELSPETALIQEELFELNNKGWFSLASQPAVDGCKSSDKIFGWGPSNGVIYQKPFVELFVPKKDWNDIIYPRMKSWFDSKVVTYYLGDCQNKITSNLSIGPNSHNSKSAITWGVFPLKEVLQPTIIDYESFKAWNEEAFLLWLEWARCYKKTTKSFEILNNVYNDYYLVSLIHHDFKNESGLWDALLGNE
ncbi:methylenetetrahydrofolate reduct [Hyphopichia burtonii NRRL Y-1933]|uniref:Methylenetetrahydrofolate reduct n=1 Tax=Hyphopichia burtonii NRRL Y-1933 TaxID=984485 RepID=A0A1E4RE71_9ASCO|nr:methylenetetrahydrofolate reduct [Hyphopichia burtonii NRRL Y-1933]ODV65541.1 methylenetetrahydrofolate reduct [Hyphopichia burtonii NRRL Y-1933]